MLVEYQPWTPSRRAFRPGRDDRLDQRLTGLQILAGQRRLGLRRELDQRRDVGRQIRRGVRVRNPLAHRRVRVDHARRNRLVVLLERALEVASDWCTATFLHVDLGAAAPHHDEPIELVLLLERADVVHHLLGEVALVLALLDVRTVEPLHVALIEDRRHRLDGFELGRELLEQRRLEHARRPRRGVAVLFEDVPAAEHEIVERRERHDVADLRRSALGALAEADRAHLRQRADRFGEAFSDGDERRRSSWC